MNRQVLFFCSVVFLSIDLMPATYDHSSMESSSLAPKTRQPHPSEDKVAPIHSSKSNHKHLEPLMWNISKKLWGLGSTGIESDGKRWQKGFIKGKRINRRRRFRRPPKGKVVAGSANVNNPGFFSASAHRPNSLGCTGPNCKHLSPSTFWRPINGPSINFRGRLIPAHGTAPYTRIFK